MRQADFGKLAPYISEHNLLKAHNEKVRKNRERQNTMHSKPVTYKEAQKRVQHYKELWGYDMSGSARKKEKRNFKVALIAGSILVAAALAIFVKLFMVVYGVAMTNGDYYDSEVIIYAIVLLFCMFASGMFLAPVIKVWEKKRGARVSKNIQTRT